jgi:hypothetical protein
MDEGWSLEMLADTQRYLSQKSLADQHELASYGVEERERAFTRGGDIFWKKRCAFDKERFQQ